MNGPEGRPYLYSVRISEPGVAESSRFLARFAEWRDGAVVMTTATPEHGNPHTPADHMVICPLPGTVVVIDYIGKEGDE